MGTVLRQDGRDPGAVNVGANNVDEDNGYPYRSNTLKRIVLNPEQDVTVNSWLGKHVIIRDPGGGNHMLGDVVATEHTIIDGSATYLYAIEFASELPTYPVQTNKLDIYDTYGGIASYQDHVGHFYGQLEEEISDIVFETTIEDGFSRCTITLNDRAKYFSRLASELPSLYIQVFDPQGAGVYSGIIISTSFTGSGGVIEATSIKSTLGWKHANIDAVFEDYTSAAVLREIVQMGSWINYNSRPMTNSYWEGVQSVIDWDWTDGSYTILDIMNDVLKIGYPDTDSTGDFVAVQIWENAIPMLKVFPRYPDMDEVDWLIGADNFGANMDKVSFESGLDQVDSMMYSEYTDENGETLQTTSAYTPHYLMKFGVKDEIHNVSANSKSIVTSSLYAAKKEREYLGRPGSINVIGNVKSSSGYRVIAPYLIRSGDIVGIEGQLDIASSSTYKSRDESTGIFVVGSTSYSASSGELTITAKQPLSYRELYNTRISLK